MKKTPPLAQPAPQTARPRRACVTPTAATAVADLAAGEEPWDDDATTIASGGDDLAWEDDGGGDEAEEGGAKVVAAGKTRKRTRDAAVPAKKGKKWRTRLRLFAMGREFQRGVADMVPYWHALGHKVRLSPSVARPLFTMSSVRQMRADGTGSSKYYHQTLAHEWQSMIAPGEHLANAILSLTAPKAYQIAWTAQRRLRETGPPSGKGNVAAHASAWPSVYSGIAVIVNRATPSHLDGNGAIAGYDGLSSLGTHRRATLNLDDIGATFAYPPGTFVELCGKFLRHEVGPVPEDEGERICYARFTRDALQHYLHGKPIPFVRMDADFRKHMNYHFWKRFGGALGLCSPPAAARGSA